MNPGLSAVVGAPLSQLSALSRSVTEAGAVSLQKVSAKAAPFKAKTVIKAIANANAKGLLDGKRSIVKLLIGYIWVKYLNIILLYIVYQKFES